MQTTIALMAIFFVDGPWWKTFLFAIIVVALILVVIALGIIVFYRHYKKQEIKILEKLNDLLNLPILAKLNRLQEISFYNPEYINAYANLSHKYNALLETQLISINATIGAIKLNNLRRYRSGYRTLMQTKAELFETEKDMRALNEQLESILVLDQLARKTLVFYKDLFVRLKNNLIKLRISQYVNVNEQAFDQLHKNFDTHLNNLNEAYLHADFSKLAVINFNIVEGLKALINIIDKWPHVYVLVHYLIPQKIEQLNQTYLSDEKINAITKQQYKAVASGVIAGLKQAAHFLQTLQYKKAISITKTVLNNLLSFDQQVKNEATFKIVFNDGYHQLILTAEAIDAAKEQMIEQTIKTRNNYGLTVSDKNTITAAVEAATNFDYLLSKLTAAANRTMNPEPYWSLIQGLVAVTTRAIKTIDAMSTAIKILNNYNEDEHYIQRSIAWVENILLQLDTKMAIPAYRRLAAKFITALTDAKATLEHIQVDSTRIENNNELLEVLDAIQTLKDKVYQLYVSFQNTVLIDQLAQAAIVYAQSFVTADDLIATKVLNSQYTYEQGKPDAALAIAVDALNAAKERKLLRKYPKTGR